MIRYWLRRLLIAIGRLLGGLLLLVAATELSMLLSQTRGADSQHVAADIISLINGSAKWGGENEEISVVEEVMARIASSSGILLLASLIATGISVPLGIWLAKSSRLRPLLEALVFPLGVSMWIPTFWFACLVVLFLVNVWGQPVYGLGRSGIEAWWRIFLPAMVIAFAMVGWQVRAVSQQMRQAMKAGHVRAARIRGHHPNRVFYRGVFCNSLKPIVRGIDQALPSMLSALIVVEWVFRYPGLGALTLESARESNYVGLMGAGVAMLFLIVSIRLIGEVTHALVDPQLVRSEAN